MRTVLVSAAAAVATIAVPAAAVYTYDPVGPTGWTPDGPVHATVASGDRVFVGGSFTGGVVALDAGTGDLLWNGNADGDVRALAVSADGSRLIAGGAFTAVDGETHRRLASLAVTDGSVQSSWRARTAGTVRDVVVRGDVAYFGGFFRRHDGLLQRSLGAVLVSTGRAVEAFDPQTDGAVLGLALDGDRLVVAGRFTTVDGAPRAALAAVSLPQGTLQPWTPPEACGGCNVHWDVLAAPGTVYTATRNAGAVSAFDSVTGSRRWRVTANGDAQALALADGLLYVGGHFAEIGSPRQPRSILAALDARTGTVDPDFRPRFVDSYPGIWALHATSDVLYVGGHFVGAGEVQPRRYPYFAMFD